MQVVRYQFREVIGEFDISIKKNARLLDVQRMNGNPTLYALAQPGQEDEIVHFHLYHSDQAIPEDKLLSYMGTFQGQGGLYDYHLFREYPILKNREDQAPTEKSPPIDPASAAV